MATKQKEQSSLCLMEENGDPKISYLNAMKTIQQYGSIVGVIQCVIPFEEESKNKTSKIVEKQVTQIFFSKGNCMEFYGFFLSSLSKKTKKLSENEIAGKEAFCTILKTMPGFDEQMIRDDNSPLMNQIEKDKKVYQELINDPDKPEKVIYYAFDIPEHINVSPISKSPGYKAFKDCIELLEEDEEKIRIFSQEI